MFINDNYAWTTIDSTSGDGYNFTTARITGQVDGNPVEGAGSKGPLLMIHGLFRDGASWLFPTNDGRPTYPV